MKITILGRQVDVPDDLRPIFDKKLKKLDKFFKDDATAYVTLSKKRGKEILELTISSGGTLFRSEEEQTTFQNAFDRAMDSIERQIRKNKTRLEKRLREGAFIAGTDVYSEPIEEEPEFNIRIKEFPIKPMSPEEAILQMNLLGHEFFVFRNDKTQEVNVVYRRKDYNYGVIIPTIE